MSRINQTAIAAFILGLIFSSNVFATQSEALALVREIATMGVEAVSTSRITDQQLALMQVGKMNDEESKRLLLQIVGQLNADRRLDKSLSPGETLLLYAARSLAEIGEPAFQFTFEGTNRQSQVAKVLMMARQSDQDLWRGVAFETYPKLIARARASGKALNAAEVEAIRVDIQNLYPKLRTLKEKEFEIREAGKSLTAISFGKEQI